jgi:hypothetical protein
MTPDDPQSSLATADLFDRPTETTSKAGGPMSTVRWRASAVTLLDGHALVVGGACWDDFSACAGQPTSADLFDPQAGTFAPTPSPLNKMRVDVRAVLLPDGRVFLSSSNDPTVELYDPAAGTFTLATPLAPHGNGVVVRLRDGRVLMAGGGGFGFQPPGTMPSASAEIFDPDLGTFAMVGSLQTARYTATAHTLPDGRVLVLGGATGAPGQWTPLDSIEIFDPKTTQFTTASYKLTVARFGAGSALVRDGTVIALGGYTTPGQCNSATNTVDQIDPVKGVVSAFAQLPHANTEVNAATLLDGSIVAVGGGACGTSLAMPYVDYLPGKATQ